MTLAVLCQSLSNEHAVAQAADAFRKWPLSAIVGERPTGTWAAQRLGNRGRYRPPPARNPL